MENNNNNPENKVELKEGINNNKYILLVEDDAVDVMTVKRAARKLGIKNPIRHGENGEEGLAILEEHDPDLPAIILLDINMPKMNGLEFLKVIKEHPRFKVVPVIMLTTSREDQDRYQSFNHSVAGYMVKPVEFKKFLDVMDIIRKYWSISEFPD